MTVWDILTDYKFVGTGEEVRSHAVRKQGQKQKGQEGETLMKVGRKSLRMSNGTIRHFKSQRKRDNFERVARAYKHGWRPKGRRRGR